MEGAYVRKAGWIWRYTRSHRKWVKRWAVFDSSNNSFAFYKSPSQKGNQEKSQKRGGSLEIKDVTLLKHRLIHDDSKLYGLAAELSNGKSMTLCFQTSDQRSEWLNFIGDCLTSEVTLDGLYEVHSNCVLGQGAFADVVLGIDRATGEPVAVKMVTEVACKKHFELMDKEAQIMSMVGSHPHLLGLRNAFYSENHIFLVSDLLEGGNLQHAMSRTTETSKAAFCEDRARAIFKQVLLAVDCLHDMGIASCDVKPENILRCRDSDAHVRLTDFNSATFFDDTTEPGGTPEYLAPELASLENIDPKPGWNSALDMWSVGITLFWMLHGFTPFHADTVPEILHKVQQASFEWPTSPMLSADAKDLILSLLQRDPSKRLSAKAALEHPWTRKEGALKPLLTIMADARALIPAIAIGSEHSMYPVSTPCSAIDHATLAAMHASTPTHLCIRVPHHGTSINYGFAASTAQIIETDELESDLGMALSSLEVSDSFLSIDCPSLNSPGESDPMDSCMSVHRDLSFKGSEAELSNLASRSSKEEDLQRRHERTNNPVSSQTEI